MYNSKSLKVLVVEDEALLRIDAIDFTEDAGFIAQAANSADEAIKFLTAENDIGIVFTDIEMPGSMDGLALAQIVHAKWPNIAIIVTSGRVSVTPDMLPPGGTFYAKPYLPEIIIAEFKRAAEVSSIQK